MILAHSHLPRSSLGFSGRLLDVRHLDKVWLLAQFCLPLPPSQLLLRGFLVSLGEVSLCCNRPFPHGMNFNARPLA